MAKLEKPAEGRYFEFGARGPHFPPPSCVSRCARPTFSSTLVCLAMCEAYIFLYPRVSRDVRGPHFPLPSCVSRCARPTFSSTLVCLAMCEAYIFIYPRVSRDVRGLHFPLPSCVSRCARPTFSSTLACLEEGWMDKSNDCVLSDFISKHLYHNENLLFFPTNALIIRFQRKPFRLPLSYHSCIAKWLRVYFSENLAENVSFSGRYSSLDTHHTATIYLSLPRRFPQGNTRFHFDQLGQLDLKERYITAWNNQRFPSEN